MSTRDLYPPKLAVARTLVGRGWWPLLERVYELAETEGIVPMQIKEKGGGLRVAWAPEDVRRIGRDKLYGLSQELESESYRRCEACGEPGEPVQASGRGDWKKTLCPEHAAMRAAGARWDEIFGFQPYTTPIEGEALRDRLADLLYGVEYDRDETPPDDFVPPWDEDWSEEP